MKDRSLNVLPEYNGALLSYLDVKDTSTTTESPRTRTRSRSRRRPRLRTAFPPSPIWLRWPPRDLRRAPEDKVRFQGVVGLNKVYGLKFKSFRSLDQAGPLTINALSKGSVDAAILYSTTPEIEQRGFVALTDPENVFGSQNIIPFINQQAVPQKARVVLNSISKTLDTTTLTAPNAKVQIDKDDAGTVAKALLQQRGLV